MTKQNDLVLQQLSIRGGDHPTWLRVWKLRILPEEDEAYTDYPLAEDDGRLLDGPVLLKAGQRVELVWDMDTSSP